MPYYNNQQFPVNNNTFTQTQNYRYPNQNQNQNSQYKKKSGCKTSKIENGKNKGHISIHGWNKSKSRGFITFSAFPKKGAKKYPNENKTRYWMPYLVEVKFHNTMETRLMNGLFDTTTYKLIIDEFQMVANPKAPNGGYFGTFKS
ncbi:MAG: hypothetical protein ACOCRK_05175 [bacterium]